MRNLSPEVLKALVQGMGHAEPFREGVIVPHFNLLEVAAALEREATIPGCTKVTLHMDREDAVKLAKVFRKLAQLR